MWDKVTLISFTMEMNGTGVRDVAENFALASSVAVTVISVVGLILNTYIMFIIVVTRQTASASSLLLMHLGAVGALASGAALCSEAACLCGAVLHALHPLQLWTVCGLHADRAAAIAAPLHYSNIVSAKKVLFCVASGWVATAALLAPLAASRPPLAYSVALGSCVPDCSDGPTALVFCLIYALFTLFIPTTLVLLCSLKILRIARYHRHRIAAAIYEVTLSAQVTITHQRNPFAPPPPARRRSALSAVLQPLGSLAILYFPYYCVLIWPAIAIPPRTLASISATLLATAPTVNGILYGIRSHALRDSLRNYIRKRVTKSEVTQEIQARTPSACGSRRPSLSAGSGSIRPPAVRRLSDAAAMGARGAERPAPRASSCNILQNSQEEELRPRVNAIPVIRAPPYVVLGRALGLEEPARDRRRRQSPKITVTRAMSDDSESPTRRPLCRQHSRSSGALLASQSYSPILSGLNHLDQAEEHLLLWPQDHNGCKP